MYVVLLMSFIVFFAFFLLLQMNIWTDTTKPYSSRNKVYTMLTYFSYRQTILYLYLYFTYTLLILYLSIIYLYLYFTYSYTYTLRGAKYTPGWRTSLIVRRSCPQSSSIIYIHHPEVYLDNISVSRKTEAQEILVRNQKPNVHGNM